MDLNTNSTRMEEKRNTCSKAFIAATNLPLSYSISIGMRGHSRFTIKIPKLTVKTMYTKFHLRAKRGKKANNLMYENQSIVGPLYQLLKLEVEEIWEPRGRKDNGNPLLALSRFLDQKKGWKIGGHSSEGGDEDNIISSWRVLRMKARSWGLELDKAMSKLMKNKVRKQFEEDRKREEDEGQVCLCKKRILMGERCKPLHSLQYDSDGILIPDTDLV